MARWFTNTNPGLRRFWYPVASLQHLAGCGPHPVRLLGQDWVLFKSTDGWSVIGDTCPHRLAPLSQGRVVDGRLRCGYHGWCFDQSGQVVSIPNLEDGAAIPAAAATGGAAAVEERYGLVWVAVSEPVADIPALGEWGDHRFEHVSATPQIWRASAAQMADNAMDLATRSTVERQGWQLRVESSGSSLPRSNVVVDGPFHVSCRIADGDGTQVAAFFHQPIDDAHTALYHVVLADGGPAKTGQASVKNQTLLERFGQKAVPLDAGVETYTAADVATVAFRRLLADVDALGSSQLDGDLHTAITPSDIGPPAANYAHARLATGATRSLHTSGVVPVGPDGSVPANLVDQAELVWANINAMLRDAGMTVGDVVSVTTYVTPGLELGPVMAIRDRELHGLLAASTLLVVPELARPEWLLEIAVVAEAR